MPSPARFCRGPHGPQWRRCNFACSFRAGCIPCAIPRVARPAAAKFCNPSISVEIVVSGDDLLPRSFLLPLPTTKARERTERGNLLAPALCSGPRRRGSVSLRYPPHCAALYRYLAVGRTWDDAAAPALPRAADLKSALGQSESLRYTVLPTAT